MTRYWYNASAEMCQVYHYLGCGANPNSFPTLEECTKFCKITEEGMFLWLFFNSTQNQDPTCPHGEPIRLDDGKYWKCDHTGKEESLANCPLNYECYYNGKRAGCCTKKDYTCTLLPDPGKICNSGTTQTRWYFDSALRTCKSFDYSKFWPFSWFIFWI